MMHFAATGVSLLALIFAAVGAFTNFIVVLNKDDKKPLIWYDGSRLCVDNDGTVTCTVYPELKKDYDKADMKWEGSIPHNMELAGIFSLLAFIFAIITFLVVAAATGAKVAAALDGAKRKLIFLGGAGLGGLAALMSLVGWAIIAAAYTDPTLGTCKDGEKCTLADVAKERADNADSKVEGPNLAEGFALQIVAFVFLIAAAALSGVAGTQEEENGAEGKSTAPEDALSA